MYFFIFYGVQISIFYIQYYLNKYWIGYLLNKTDLIFYINLLSCDFFLYFRSDLRKIFLYFVLVGGGGFKMEIFYFWNFFDWDGGEYFFFFWIVQFNQRIDCDRVWCYVEELVQREIIEIGGGLIELRRCLSFWLQLDLGLVLFLFIFKVLRYFFVYLIWFEQSFCCL